MIPKISVHDDIEEHKVICPQCNGTGGGIIDMPLPFGGVDSYWELCWFCEGRGYMTLNEINSFNPALREVAA